MKTLLLLSLLLWLGGCASVTRSNTQEVSVRTVCEGVLVSNANCLLKNDKGQWNVSSPGSTMVNKSYEGLYVRCERNGASGENSYISKNNVGAWGNYLLGGGIGYLVDVQSGSGFDYPDSITVVLQPPCT
jgi:hypothetical protein